MNDEQIEKIDAEIQRLIRRKQEISSTAMDIRLLQQSHAFIEGMVHALQWARSNL
jgi:hypothetical protein